MDIPCANLENKSYNEIRVIDMTQPPIPLALELFHSTSGSARLECSQ